MTPDMRASWEAACEVLSEGDDAERLAAVVMPGIINVHHRDYTLLMTAICRKRVMCVRWLCEHGANVNGTNEHKWTALRCATFHGNLECIGVLLQHGATVDVMNTLGHTPLHYALKWRYDQCARLLLYNGASLATLRRGGDIPPYARDIVCGQEQCRAACRALLALRVAGRDVTPVIARMLWTTRGMDVWQDAPATGKRRVGE